MDITKKSRTELKAYFIKNAVPTESNFRDFIDGVLNHKDDGLTKSADAPLSIEAQSSGDRPIVHLYDSFSSQSPNFVISLLPGTTSASHTVGRGLGIGNGSGAANACLFVDQDSGGVGIGTVTPSGYRLAVAGAVNISGLLSPSGGVTIPAGQSFTNNGSTQLSGGATVSGGILQANAGLLIPAGQTLQASGTVNLGAGATVSGGALNANGGLQVPAGQTLAASGGVNFYAGATVSGGTLQANAGLNVPSGQTLTVNGVTNLNAGATVSGGTLQAAGGLTVPAGQTLTTLGTVTLAAGATISGGTLNAAAGIQVPSGQSLTVEGSVSLKSGATVTGSALNANAGLTVATGQSLIANGTVSLNSGATVAGGTLNANGGLTVPSGQSLTANGGVSLNAGATVSGSTLNANAGLAVPSGQTLTANGAVKLNSGATITGSALLAQAGATITGGGLTVGTTTAAQSVTVYGSLATSAGATITGGGLTVGAAGSAQPLVVYGLVSGAAGATFTGGTVTVGTTTANQALAINGTLATTSSASVGGALTVVGATLLDSLSTSNNVSLGGTLTTTGASTLNSTLSVGGAAALSSTLTVNGATSLKAGAAVTGGALTVGTSSAAQTMTVYGLLTAAADAKVTGALTVSGNSSLAALSTSSTTALGGTLTVTGATALTSTLAVTGATSLSSTLTVSGQSNLQGALVVAGASYLQSSVTINGTDLNLDNTSRRGGRSGSTRRALVHDGNDSLSINYAGDYTSGVRLHGQLALFGRTWLQTNSIYLAGTGDHNHGLGLSNGGRPFAGSNVNGPVLHGYSGGALGSVRCPVAAVEGALVLAGTNGHAVMPAMTDDFSSGLTMEAWVYLSSLSNSYARIIDFGNGAGTDNVILCQKGTSTTLRLHVYYNSTSAFSCDASDVLATGSWMHLAATVDASGNVKMYKNGSSVSFTTTGTVSLPGSTKRNNCYLGRSNWTNDGYLQGKLANVRIWRRALSAEEIADRYDNTCAVSTSSLAASWPMDDASGSSIRDSSGNGRSGTLSTDNAAFESYQAVALTWSNTKNVTIGNDLTVAGDVSISGTSKSGNIRNTVTKTDAISTTKTTAEDMSGLSITATFAAGPILVLVTLGAVSIDVSSSRAVFLILVDGSVVYTNMQEWPNTGYQRRDVTMHAITTVTAGSHTIKVQWHRDASANGTTLYCGLNNTAGSTNRTLSVIEL